MGEVTLTAERGNRRGRKNKGLNRRSAIAQRSVGPDPLGIRGQLRALLRSQKGLPQADPSSRYCPLLALVWSYHGLFGSENKAMIVCISAAGGKSERILLISNKSHVFSARFGPSEPQDFRKNSAQA